MLEFLIEKVDGRKGAGCLKAELELDGIRYGSSVMGYANCRLCGSRSVLGIHIEFV